MSEILSPDQPAAGDDWGAAMAEQQSASQLARDTAHHLPDILFALEVFLAVAFYEDTPDESPIDEVP